MDDVVLDGQRVDRLLIADVVAPMSMSVQGILDKGDQISLFCALNFLVLCVIKTLALSADPYMRYRMRDASIPMFCPALKPGKM